MSRRLKPVLLFIFTFVFACSRGGAGEDRTAQPEAVGLAQKMAARAGA